jgi:insulysin
MKRILICFIALNSLVSSLFAQSQDDNSSFVSRKECAKLFAEKGIRSSNKALEQAIQHYLTAKQKSVRVEGNEEGYEVLADESSLEASSFTNGDTLKIRLENGLSAYLICNPSLKESAASLAVEAGSWDDPAEFPGMAHFVEHLLFLGSDAYPKEMDYSQYIVERGGECNAFTSHDRTIYGFSIHHDGFEGALDRLSHFFIDPLFTASAVRREANAVHHEFEDSIENDSIRAWRILKETGNENHPNAVFSCGNLDSLADVTPKEVRKWYEKHYLPSHMNLVLFSPLPLQRQIQLAVKYFSKIPVRCQQKNSKEHYEGPTITDKQKGHCIYVAPSFKNRSLLLLWEIPKAYLELGRDRVFQLIQMALDHGSSNSLARVLETEGLAKEVHVDFWKIEKEHAFFMIDVFLTKEGIRQSEDVIFRCFQAIHQLKEIGIPEYLFEHLTYLENKQLKNIVTQNTFDYVMEIASDLLDEEIHTYPEKTYIPSQMPLQACCQFLEELIPENCVYFLIASPEETGVKLSMMEKWMGSEYVIREIPHEQLQQWARAPAHPEIGVQPIEYYEKAREEIIIPQREIEQENIPEPLFIVEDSAARIRLIEDVSEENEINAFFCLVSSTMGHSLKNAALNILFIQSLEQHLRKTLPAQQGIHWSFEIDGNELCIFLNVKKDDAQANFSTFFSLLKNRQLSEADFEQFKRQFLDSYAGDPEPLEYAHELLGSIFQPSSYTKMEIYHVIPDLCFQEFQEFGANYFKQLYIEGAFLGNLDTGGAMNLWKEIQSTLEATPYHVDFDKEENLVCFPDEACFILQNTHRKGNALLLLLDAGEASVENWAAQKMIAALIQQEFFEELRTKQQTAYKLYNWSEHLNRCIFQCFAIQSSTHHPLDLLHRVETFLKNFLEEKEEKVNKERFELIKKTLVSNVQRQMQNIERQDDMDVLHKNMESIRALSYSQILDVLYTVFSKSNHKRMAILIKGNDVHSEWENEPRSIFYLQRDKEQFNQ